MNCSVLAYRILAGLIVVLLGVLVSWGRALEAFVAPLVPDRTVSAAVLVTAGAVAVSALGRGCGWGFQFKKRFFLASVLGIGVCLLIVRTSAEWVHILTYGMLGFALARSGLPGGGLAILSGALLVGVADELVQSLQPNRVGDPWDIALDLVGAAIGLSMSRLSVPAPALAGNVLLGSTDAFRRSSPRTNVSADSPVFIKKT